MRSYEDATSRPHGHLMLDLKPTTDDQKRLKTTVLPRLAPSLSFIVISIHYSVHYMT
jgi:hypothetical protein